MAFVKRLLHTCFNAQVSLVCGVLFLVSEVLGVRGLQSMCDFVDADDGIENFKDADEAEGTQNSTEAEVSTSEAASKNAVESNGSATYDPRKRDPKYAKAEYAALWELIPYTFHFHPTIKLYAKTILEKKQIECTSVNYDPLLNHTMSRFLDRFVYKAPKVVGTTYKGESIHQPRVVRINIIKSNDHAF